MSDENNTTNADNGEFELEEKPQRKVELDEATYAALLDRVEELESRELSTPQRGQHRDEDDEDSLIDKLAKEGRRDSDIPEIAPPGNLDSMSNSELVNFIVDVINKQATPRMRDMEVKYETLRVLREIDKAESKYDDFWKYEKDIKKISMANPSLSIEHAYKLAKAEAPPTNREDGEKPLTKKTKTERLLNLPSRGAFGEKPSVATSTTAAVNRGQTLKSAAERAWEETVGKDKPNI